MLFPHEDGAMGLAAQGSSGQGWVARAPHKWAEASDCTPVHGDTLLTLC